MGLICIVEGRASFASSSNNSRTVTITAQQMNLKSGYFRSSVKQMMDWTGLDWTELDLT